MLKPEDHLAIPYSENDTDVLGDICTFMRYYRRGTAFEEYQKRMAYIEKSSMIMRCTTLPYGAILSSTAITPKHAQPRRKQPP